MKEIIEFLKNRKSTTVVLISIVVILLLQFVFNLWDDNSKVYVRKNIHSNEAKKDVEALVKALEIMRRKDCSDPTSWYYQGAIHWIPDTITNNKLCSSYQTLSDLKPGWDNCTHTPGGQEVLHFLVWHRMYIYHFEKIVRKLSGYDDFALPYWAYTNDNTKDKTLQNMFRIYHSSLYESARFDSLNMGYPVSGEIERALDTEKLFSYTSYELFCKNIDKAPHGAMHDYIGAGNDTTGLLKFDNKITGKVSSTGLMGWVPTAAFDPIFWTHHSNIDRLWQQWSNSRNGQPVTYEELFATPWPYVFFDENGNKVEYTVSEVLKIIYDLDYEFDDTKMEKPKKLTKISLRNANPLIKKLEHKMEESKTSLLIDKRQLKKGDIIEVSVSFTDRPKGSYEVYLSLDNDPHPSDDGFLGYMTFFGADHIMPGESCYKCCGALTVGRKKMKFTFEVTNSQITDAVTLHILKHNKKVHNDLIIEEVTIE